MSWIQVRLNMKNSEMKSQILEKTSPVTRGDLLSAPMRGKTTKEVCINKFCAASR